MKGKIYKQTTANDSKSYYSYLNKLVDEYNNTHHRSINKKPIDADYTALSEKLRQILKLLNLKLVIESELLKYKMFFAKFTQKIGQKKYFL